MNTGLIPKKMTAPAINLFPHQSIAVGQLKTGSILCGGVGSGKSLTSLVYYYTRVCGGEIVDGRPTEMKNPLDLYIITTAHKRDTLDWESECRLFLISKDRTLSMNNVKLVVDSWNNIKKYEEAKEAFFIFDEQRVVGSGAWVKSFIRISKKNKWILLSATPGDTWMDYIPVFIANGFYKSRAEFIRRHVVYNTFTKYPKVDHYVEISSLQKFKETITVLMDYEKKILIHKENVMVSYDQESFRKAAIDRWNPFENRPIKDVGEYCYIMRKVVNSDMSRLEAIKTLLQKHRRLVIFYNFNYELEILRLLQYEPRNIVAEHNGQKHDPLPEGEHWCYLVQYASGAEGWNCITTNVVVFYSQNYSYRAMTQAAGRIDRMNTPFTHLYYYTLRSSASIDMAISKSLLSKKDFNEKKFLERR